MDVNDIQREIEHVDSSVEKNVDQKLVLGFIARGVWQVALQVARLADVHKELGKVDGWL